MSDDRLSLSAVRAIVRRAGTVKPDSLGSVLAHCTDEADAENSIRQLRESPWTANWFGTSPPMRRRSHEPPPPERLSESTIYALICEAGILDTAMAFSYLVHQPSERAAVAALKSLKRLHPRLWTHDDSQQNQCSREVASSTMPRLRANPRTRARGDRS